MPPSVPSGPSFSGKRASAGLRLPDLTMKKQHGGAEEEARRRSGWLRRAGRIGGRGRGELRGGGDGGGGIRADVGGTVGCGARHDGGRRWAERLARVHCVGSSGEYALSLTIGELND